MKIAIVAPPWTTLPSEDHTGIEPTIFNLAEEYVKANQKVVLFAPHGSVSSAETICYPEIPSEFDIKADTIRFFLKDIFASYAYMKACSEGADIIHDFTLGGDYNVSIPVIHTVYGPPTEQTVKICLKACRYANNHLVAVSNRQRGEFSEISQELHFVDTIPKCVNTETIKWGADKEDYLLYFGSPEQKKDIELARRVAVKSKHRLVAVIHGSREQDYGSIKPRLQKDAVTTDIRLTEDLPRESRHNLYRKASAAIHISRWKEPFSMEILESLACGTPVIALRRSAAPEVIEEGKTGFLVETEKEILQAIEKLDSINPEDCRKAAEEKFSSKVISQKYLKLYRSFPQP